jgi:hypothetical protein
MGYGGGRGGHGTDGARMEAVRRMRRQARSAALAAALAAAAAAAVAAAAVTAAAVAAAALAGCSVPREADLLASGSPSSATTPTPMPTPTPTPPPVPTATPAPTPTSPPAPTATPAPTPTPTPRPRAVKAPTAKAVPGYRLSAAPRGLGDPLEAVRGAGDLFGAVTVKSVTKGDTPVGLLFLFAVRPQDVGDPRIASLVLPKVVAGVTGGGIPVKMQRFGDQRVAVGSSAKQGTIVLWYNAGVLAVVLGGGPDMVTRYAKAYVARR